MANLSHEVFAAHLTHDVFEPNKTVSLSPFAVCRSSGQICDATRSAARTLHILELLAKAGKPLRAVEIAAPLGLSPSTTSQLLKTLVDSAHLIFNPLTKRYCPSPRVGSLGAAVAENYFGPMAINHLIRKVMHLGSITTTVSTSQGAHMQLIEIVSHGGERSSLGGLGVHPSVGLRMPLFGSCIGAAWLSTQSEKIIRAYAQQCRRELTAPMGDINRILERIEDIKQQGYAFGGLTTMDEAVRGIAVPLPPSRNEVVLVLGVSGPSREMESKREEIAANLKEAIQALTCH